MNFLKFSLATQFQLLVFCLVHEKQRFQTDWNRVAAAPDQLQIPLRIALAQQNIHKIDGYLFNISSPSSQHYSKHWSPSEIADTFRPRKESVDEITKWLQSASFADDRIAYQNGWIELRNATIGEVKGLLQADYHIYSHHESEQKHVACQNYSIPDKLKEHVDFITPTVHFDRKVDNRQQLRKRQLTSTGNSTNPKNCYEAITPQCLKDLYGIPETGTKVENNTIGVLEFRSKVYVQEDLDLFFQQYAPYVQNHTPNLKSINGGAIYTHLRGSQYNAEADMDLEYVMALVAPQEVDVYQVGDLESKISFNNFLDALDGSYCEGDDPIEDPGPKNFTKSCGEYEPPLVISSSYVYNEADLTPAYANRQCLEYAKLGLMGVSFIQASGDFGVAGNKDKCLNGSSSPFNPSFPSSCPYVTSVGATQLEESGNESAMMQHKGRMRSGGGFSNYFTMPSYQSQAVQTYLQENENDFRNFSSTLNTTTRAYPDVSANGSKYATIINGRLEKSSGTSASAPTFASVITLINGQRLLAGKRPLGFLNPVFYEHPEILNDVTSGRNPGCGTEGYATSKGWDPVSGNGEYFFVD